MSRKLPVISTIFLIFLSVVVFQSCQQPEITEYRNDFKPLYDHYKVDGSFVLYDASGNHYYIYNESKYHQGFTPASTFKICNSLIGLETGVVKDENTIFKWDSIQRWNTKWNTDHSLASAFKNSVVWYYQELARKVGGANMKYWLDKAGYGNRDTSGGIDRFWLNGGIRISPEQQINFLRQLHDEKLPFSKRSMQIVKKIMIAKDTAGYVVRAKTGWGQQDGLETGWYVGYLEKNDKVYYFANCIQTKDTVIGALLKARIDLVYQILGKLKIL